MEATHEKQGNGRRQSSLQARIDALELEARGRIIKALGAGQHRLDELDGLLERVSREDWSVDGMRKRLETLRTRAEQLRASAMKRVNELPASAVSALASGTRGPVQNLARELERLAKRVEARPESAAKSAEVVQPNPPEARPGRARRAEAPRQVEPAVEVPGLHS